MKQKDKWECKFTHWTLFVKEPGALNALRKMGTAHHQKTIEAACKRFDLDPESPSDRELALVILADILFPNAAGNALTSPPRGAPTKWDEAAMIRLKRDIVNVCPSLDASAPDIATLLRERFPKKYRSIVDRSLTFRVREAFRHKK